MHDVGTVTKVDWRRLTRLSLARKFALSRYSPLDHTIHRPLSWQRHQSPHLSAGSSRQ